MLKRFIDKLITIYYSMLHTLTKVFDIIFKISMSVIGYQSVSYAISMTFIVGILLFSFFQLLGILILLSNPYLWVVSSPALVLLLTLSFHGCEKIRDMYVIDDRGENISTKTENKRQ